MPEERLVRDLLAGALKDLRWKGRPPALTRSAPAAYDTVIGLDAHRFGLGVTVTWGLFLTPREKGDKPRRAHKADIYGTAAFFMGYANTPECLREEASMDRDERTRQIIQFADELTWRSDETANKEFLQTGAGIDRVRSLLFSPRAKSLLFNTPS